MTADASGLLEPAGLGEAVPVGVGDAVGDCVGDGLAVGVGELLGGPAVLLGVQLGVGDAGRRVLSLRALGAAAGAGADTSGVAE